MEDKFIPMLLVTANVGSIFEDPHNLLKIWVKEFLLTVKRLQPKFLALHCQEVGGKNYEESMRHVEDFVRMLMASEEFLNFGQVRVYLDEDFTCTEKFTALGNLYFVHNSLKNVQIWDYKEHEFVPVEGKEVHSGNIERVTTKEKAKFPQELFPECKWSRKGFMRTRWNVSGTIFDLINIHLFHDASNLIAMESCPSTYCKNRQNALSYALQRFSTDEYEKAPFFIFGDFNFRLDTKGIIQKLTSRTTPIHIKSAKNGEVEKVLYRDQVNENKVVLTLEKKVFDLEDHEEIFFKNNGKWLQEFDKELQTFRDQLFEFDIEFPPSYPFREDAYSGNCYMRTRCPSWCDRILLSKSARSLIDMTPLESGCPPVHYQLIGANISMGDHKPVMLLFRLLPQTGRPPPYIFASPDLEIRALQSHLPGRKTMSSPISCSCSEQCLPHRRAISTTDCVFHDLNFEPSPPSPVTPVIDITKLSVQWPSSRLVSHHSSSSEEWYSDIQKCRSGSEEPVQYQYDKVKTNSNCAISHSLEPETVSSQITLVVDSVEGSCTNHTELTDQHLPLHAPSSSCSSSSSSVVPHPDGFKKHRHCPCIIL